MFFKSIAEVIETSDDAAKEANQSRGATDSNRWR